MATDLIMPRLPDPQQPTVFFHNSHPPYQHHHQQAQQQQQQQQAGFPQTSASAATMPMPISYQQSQRANNYTHTPTPQISPLNTSGNPSPTSPTKSHITRPIRPLYMPAVLRPTEFPSKVPTSGKDGAARAGAGGEAADEEGEFRALRSNSSFMSLSNLGLSRLSRRSTGDSSKCVDGEWNLDLFPKPTGSPTREHWKPDPESTVCDHATCKRYFTYFTRRHHCRKCGNIFCDAHSNYEIPLDQDANYNPRGTPSRACAHCYAEFKEWRSRTNSQASTTGSAGGEHGHVRNASSISSTGSLTPVSPKLASPTAPARPPEAALSVPRDWNWSTF